MPDPGRYPAKTRDDHIDTLRAIACIMLVLYHVVGNNPLNGLEIDYPNPLRIFNDALVVARMPIFAVLSGLVYALRPPTRETLTKFVIGKFRRLIVPGAVAITAFLIGSNVMNTKYALPLDETWRAYAMPYAHFWFLRSIFCILVVFGLADVLLRQRYTVVLLLGAYAFAIIHDSFHFGAIDPGIPALAPFFALGVLCRRRFPRGTPPPWISATMIFALVILFAVFKYYQYGKLGVIPGTRTSPEALAWGTAFCLVLHYFLYHIKEIAWIGPYTFTIYLYHIFGTALSREVLEIAGVLAPLPFIVTGLALGIALPVTLHKLCARDNVLRWLVLGLRPLPRLGPVARHEAARPGRNL